MTAGDRLAMRLKQWRKRRAHMSQRELARRAGLSRAYVARLEIGRHDPTLSTLEKLAKALRVKVTRLLE
jgi:transcriptional regulator with XRE-family HTH domain